jgi:glycosyltransferase involved in cell wall biosynthesis
MVDPGFLILELHNFMKKIKVLRIIARLNVGGPAIHVILLTAGLDPERYESILISGLEAPEEGNMLDLADEKGVKPIRMAHLGRELHPIRDIVTLWQLVRIIRREKPDIVHTHTAKAGFVGRMAAFLAGVPIVIHTFHGHVLHGYFGPLKTGFFRLAERCMARFSTLIIAVSEQCRRDLLKYKVSGPDHIRTIPLGLELERFHDKPVGAREEIRKEFHIPQDAFVVGMIARMVPIKKHEDLFRAIPIVLQSFPDTYFLIVGDGERRPFLEELARELNITHRCVFTGFREDQKRVYEAVDLVVLTSANEGLPVAVIEALSAGKPVVSTRVGGVPELIEDGRTGYIVEPENVESIAEGLMKAVSQPEQTQAMGFIAQKETIRKFSIQRLIQDIDLLYQELLQLDR